MGEGTGTGSCPECGTPGAFAGQLVCQGCFVPFALMASAHAAAPTQPRTPPQLRTPPHSRTPPHTPVTAPTEPLPRPAAPPGAPVPRTRRDSPLRTVRLLFPGGQVVEVAAGHGIRLGRDPQLCPAVTFLAGRDNLSRIHARIDVAPDGTARITDEGSTNGTYARGYRLPANQPAPLRPGDTFRLAADVHVTVLP